MIPMNWALTFCSGYLFGVATVLILSGGRRRK